MLTKMLCTSDNLGRECVSSCICSLFLDSTLWQGSCVRSEAL